MESSALFEIVQNHIEEFETQHIKFNGQRAVKFHLLMNQSDFSEFGKGILSKKLLADVSAQFRNEDILLQANRGVISLSFFKQFGFRINSVYEIIDSNELNNQILRSYLGHLILVDLRCLNVSPSG